MPARVLLTVRNGECSLPRYDDVPGWREVAVYGEGEGAWMVGARRPDVVIVCDADGRAARTVDAIRGGGSVAGIIVTSPRMESIAYRDRMVRLGALAVVDGAGGAVLRDRELFERLICAVGDEAASLAARVERAPQVRPVA